MKNVHRITVDFLLASMSQAVGDDGMQHQFPVDPRRQIGGIYVSVFFSHRGVVTAALFARQHGAPYLRALSVTKVIELLTDFVKENYRAIANDTTVFARFDGPFSDHVTEETKEQLAAAIARSPVFKPKILTTLFPLVTVRVEDDYSCPAFFFRAPRTLLQELPAKSHSRLIPDSFPPLADWQYRRESPTSWLGIRSPNVTSSRKMLRVILGAVALTPSLTYRHMFSGRTVWGGDYTVDHSFSFSDSVTPPIMEDIALTSSDKGWLQILANKINNEARAIRRQMTALEYYYRSWALPASERFPILCMALDATYGEATHATAAVIDGVQDTLGPLDSARLRDLMYIRASVIHGGAPDVYDSRKYGRYYRTHGEDPIEDMGLLVAACLRRKIFGNALVEHVEPHQEIIEKMKAAGRIPSRSPVTILDGIGKAETTSI